MPTRQELIYRALRSAAGKGGYAEDEAGSIDGLIRRVRANAIAVVADMHEQAALQAIPTHATDLLLYYERLVGLTDDPGQTLEERANAAAALYALQRSADVPSLQVALHELDERFEVLTVVPETMTITILGRAFQDLWGGMLFGGGRQSSALPNYSGVAVLRVLLELGDGVAPNAAERRAIKLARRLLHDVIPATADLQIVTHRGFTLDVSKLDLTSFGV